MTRRWPVVAACVLALWAGAGLVMDGEDDVDGATPWLVVLGGGVAMERPQLACTLYAQGHGRQGVILTGARPRRGPDRLAVLHACGVPDGVIRRWPQVATSRDEMAAVAALLADRPGERAIVVSDALHMPRLRYLRDRLVPGDRVRLRASRIAWTADSGSLLAAAVFWFREPLAYLWYRVRY